MNRLIAAVALIGILSLGTGLAAGVIGCTGCADMPGCSMHQHDAAPAATPAAGQATATPVAFANTKCPIMGGTINPAKVPESLTRVYKDQNVAFCCAMCPGQWDKLTDAQKDAKLQAVAVK